MVGSDPAGPFFQEHDTAGRLDPTDAKFVQSVHCDYGMFGCNWRCGHADFYMNGGSAQPGCNMASDLTGCSHNYCKKVAVDSIRNEGIYQSWQCNDVDFTNAVNPTTATMGYHCSDQTTGCQCVWTSYVPPFLV
ncbi:unnamed protein product [Allacma fusca]|uniref:Lipase domain-containing protein n=1 Tax=Allacma fusca TaxID=39272 RepID=A0A8J2JR56_9HEXA|nr:unnamed protein product [Allacma fusca]